MFTALHLELIKNFQLQEIEVKTSLDEIYQKNKKKKEELKKMKIEVKKLKQITY